MLNIILSDYDEFLRYEPLFEEYRLNIPQIKVTNRFNRRIVETKHIWIDKSGIREVALA